MKLHKTIITGSVITVLAVGYVHQRVEIIRAGYELQDTKERLSGIIDRNSNLMYDLARLESPVYLLTSLNDEKIVFARCRSKHLSTNQLSLADSANADSIAEKTIGNFLDIFTVSAEAKSRK